MSSSEQQQPTPRPQSQSTSQPQPTESRRRVFVGNLTKENFDKEDLLRDFQNVHGTIEKIHFVPGKFAFVTFETAESAASALQDTRYDVRPARERGSVDAGGNQTEAKSKKKKRPKDARQSAAEKICFDYMRGICRHQNDEDKCRFSHDLPGFMETRPADIAEVTTGCPNFNLRGHCRYGAMCRLGSCHINTETGENIRKDDSQTTTGTTTGTTTSTLMKEEDPSEPLLPKEVQTQLRKWKYPFRCKQLLAARTSATTTTSEEDYPPSSTTTTTPLEQQEQQRPTTTAYYDDNNNKKKTIDFENKIYIAPLTTVGNLPFRRIMKGYGADITCGEMALAGSLLQGNHSEWALLKRHPSEDVFGVQLACAHADQGARACELIALHANVDFIDVNMGCPIDLVCKKGAGAGLMMRERKLQDLLYGMSQTLSNTTITPLGTVPITVKMRTGWDMDKPLAHRLVSKIQSWGCHENVAAIMVRASNLGSIGQCLRAFVLFYLTLMVPTITLSHHVFYNQ
jgi:tRNA-dihydrouridine synthase 3